MLINRLWLTSAMTLCLVGVAAAQFSFPRRGGIRPNPDVTRQARPGIDYVNGELMVKFYPGYGNASSLAHAAINARVVNPNVTGAQKVKLPAGMSVDAAIRYYKRLPSVSVAEPNYIYRLHANPNDPRFSTQYALTRVVAPQAWDLDLGNPSIRIAIVDTGVDYNHEDLRGKVQKGRDWANNDDDPEDENGHGTHSAGIAAASTNNGIGMAGMGYNCSIIAIKSFAGRSATLESILNGMKEAGDLKADVVSMSFGGYFPSDLQRDIVQQLHADGALLVSSSGNDNITDRSYPAAYPEVICVGSSTDRDVRSDFSNYGPDWVDVAAPGSAILSTYPGNQYVLLDGTSMATPLVSGLLGLMKSYAGNAVPTSELRTILEDTCDDVGPWVAKGRVNAFRALQNVIKPVAVSFDASDASIYANDGFTQGSNVTGVAGNLHQVDGGTFSIDSVYMNGTGSLASPMVSFAFGGDPGKMRSGKATINSSSHALATMILFFWNFDQQRWVAIGNGRGSANPSETSINLPANMNPYVRNGRVNAVLRASVPSRFRSVATTFRFSVDRFSLDVLMNP